MTKILMFCFVMIITSYAWAKTTVVNGITWTYTVSSGTASLGGGSYSSSRAVPQNTSGNITIPSTLGGYPDLYPSPT